MMITHIQGKLTEKNPSYVVIDCNGVGYYIHITVNTFEKIPDQENIKLFTYLIVREDAHILYGFMDALERQMFKLLLNVNGVGANSARMILSSLTVQEFQEAILSDDVAVIKSVKGIGPKSAQKIIIELKDKLAKGIDISQVSFAKENNIKEEALNALEVLGFSLKQITPLVERFLKDDQTLSVEDLVKKTLKSV